MKKNRLIIVLVCCTLLYMTGCGHSKDVERNVLRVGVVLYTQDDPFINALTECLRDELITDMRSGIYEAMEVCEEIDGFCTGEELRTLPDAELYRMYC